MKKIWITLLAIIMMSAFAPCCFAQEAGVYDAQLYSDGVSASDVSGSDMFVFDGEYGEDLAEFATVVTGTNYRCRVIEVISAETEYIDGGGYTIESVVQTLRVRIKEGPYKGRIAVVTYDLSDSWGGGNAPKPAKKGNLLIAQFTEESDGSLTGMVTQFGRETSLLWLAVIFLLLLVFFGGKRGLRSIIALVVTCLGLILVMIPAMVNGMNPVLAAVIASLFAIATTLIIVYGFTVKTLAAALGAFGGVFVAGLLVALMNFTMNMTGLVDDESMYLAQSVGDGTIDLRGILFAAIIIGVLGGTIDVGISIASSLDELKGKAENITGAQMMTSGINIGIDIMGASLNTLILAYVGSSIHLLMLFYTYDNPAVMVINDEMIACELLRALAGSFGLLFTVPITSFVSAAMMCKGNFGKFTPDCFMFFVVFKKIFAPIKKFFTRPEIPSDADGDETPEDLYKAAVSHRIDREEQFGDIDSDGEE